jgi:hypothetical protein
MPDIVWELNWKYPPQFPSLGDYIQIRWLNDRLGIQGISQGIVIKVTEDTIRIAPHDGHEEMLVLLAWRRGAPPEQQSVIRKEEIDA